MKILHFADLHPDITTRENVEHAMGQILDLACIEKPDLIVNAGDICIRRGYLAPWVAEALREWHCRLAEVAPVVVVAGNHDMSHRWDEAGTLRGALAISAAQDRIFLADRPCVFVPETAAGPIVVACLPYPSKYSLLAQREGVSPREVNETMGGLLAEVVRGLAVEVEGVRSQTKLGRSSPEASVPSVLVYHGSISGAKSGTELAMTTEIDVVLDERAIPDIFCAVLCGHIHKPQSIGRAVYCGSPCPLNFGEENHEHGVVIWKTFEIAAHEQARHGGPIAFASCFVPLEPKHRLVTIDLRDPITAETMESPGSLQGVKVRLIAKLQRGLDAGTFSEIWRKRLLDLGAFEVAVQIEREQEDHAARIDARADASLDSLLALYAERNPDLKDRLPALAALAAEIEGTLPPEVKAIERRAEYRLERLAWSNWKSFGEAPGAVDVLSLGRLVVIEGENASGKSNLMEVESFALWGRLPRGKQPIGELVRMGAAEMWVEVEFQAAAGYWRVRRSVRLKTNGDGTGDVQLLHRTENGDTPWVPANAGTSRETQERIEELVGPFDLYLATRFASQGDIDRLIEMTGAELKDTIQAALGIGVFAHREEAAKGRASKLTAEAASLLGEASVLESHAGDPETWRGAVADHQGEHEGALAEKENAARAITEASQAHEQAKAALAEARELEKRRSDQRAALETLEARATTLELRSADLKERIERGKTSQALLEPYEANRAELERLSVGAREHAVLQENLTASEQSLKNHAQRAKQDLARCDREIKSVEAEAERVKAQAKRRCDQYTEMRANNGAARDRELKAIEASLERERMVAGKIDVAPFGEKCADAKCGLLSLPLAAREAIPALEQKILDVTSRHLGEATAELGNWKAEAARFRTEGEEVKARLAELQVGRTETALEAVKSSEILEADVAARRQALAEQLFDADAVAAASAAVEACEVDLHRAHVTAGLEAAGKLEAVGEEWARVGADIDVTRGVLAALPEADLDALDREATAAWMDVDDKTRDLQVWNFRLAAAFEKLTVARTRLEAAEKARADAAERRARAEELRQAGDITQVYARAMSRDGVPYLLLEQSIPALEGHANRFLCTDDLKLEIEPMRDLRSGETRSEVYVRFRDRFGLHGLPAASGYQRVALGYALRAALAQVQAEAHGLRVSHWIADEGWGAFDEQRVLDGQQMLLRLAEQFDRVFFVSHVGPIREVAESRLRVLPDGRLGSTLERVS